MSLPRFSVNRPVFTTMVCLIVVVLGLVSFRQLKIDLLPSIELPTVSVRTNFEGASPEVMERTITQIVEEIIATTPGVEEISSTSSEGESRVTVTFEWGTDVDHAALDLQATLEDEVNELPEDIVRPRVNKFDIDSFPVVLIGISSKLDPVELTQLVEDQLRYRFTRIPGVAQADLWGGYDREIRVEVDPDRLRAQGISLNAVLDAIERSNLDLPAGKIEEGRYEVTLRAPAEFQNLDEIRETVIGTPDGSFVRLGQIAEVSDTYTKLTRNIRVNGERGLRIAIRKKAGANTVEVGKRILEEIDELNASFPQIRIIPVINQGNFIQRSIENVGRSVLYGGGLAVVVLLFFLRNLRSTIIISLAIPISILATFTLIYFLGFTINLMTLGGLALGVGMMVDSSIVVLENIFRRREENGETRQVAAAEGAMEVASAIVASTITTLVIFLPVVFVKGVSGMLFQDLASVIVFSLICSLLVSLSLVPMLASRFLRSRQQEADHRKGWVGRLVSASEQGFGWLESRYKGGLNGVLHHRWGVLAVSLILLGSSLFLAPFLGSEFLPASDEGEVRVTGEMEVGTRLELVDEQTRKMEAIVLEAVPEKVSSVVSVRDAEGEIRISLVPASQRARSNIEIAEDLRQKLEGKIPGMEIRTRAPQGQFLLDRLLGGDEGLTVEIRGYDFQVLAALGRAVEDAVEGIEGVTDVTRSIAEGIPQQEVRIDRERVADLGLSIEDVTQLIETAIAGTDAGEFRREGNSYRIFVQ
ncbi:MAG: efflux RND transporter permease subunit, partial [Puniceicoccales bacterium]